ncbi:ANK3 [Symbiodinium sp. CCMP2456]|nr:ANK3 [Symbiodinium sp. CCMP2456]
MLQIKMLSGEAVASLPVEEINDVRGLKQKLIELHGMPPRFRQRILLNGESLEDTVKLDRPMDLELVLLTFADVSEEAVEDLNDAAREGSVAKVQSMLQLPQDPDLLDKFGSTALHWASHDGQVVVVLLLLEAGSDVNFGADGGNGDTALMMASEARQVQVVQVLLEASADVNLPGRRRRELSRRRGRHSFDDGIFPRGCRNRACAASGLF